MNEEEIKQMKEEGIWNPKLVKKYSKRKDLEWEEEPNKEVGE